MTKLPVIVSFGGINAAGRSSGHNGFRRLVFDQTNALTQKATLQQLAALTGQIQRTDGTWRDAKGSTVDVDAFLAKHRQDLLNGTLIRKFILLQPETQGPAQSSSISLANYLRKQ